MSMQQVRTIVERDSLRKNDNLLKGNRAHMKIWASRQTKMYGQVTLKKFIVQQYRDSVTANWKSWEWTRSHNYFEKKNQGSSLRVEAAGNTLGPFSSLYSNQVHDE